MVKKERWIYDIEVFPNLFLLCAISVTTKRRVYFLVCKGRNDRQAMFEWMRDEVEDMVGFNNQFYDYPVIHYAITKIFNLKSQEFCYKLYEFSKKLIASNRNFMKIRPNEVLRPQIDLFKINHFDNKAKMTSLKLLEFNLRMKNIIDLPLDPHTPVPDNKVQEIIQYCFNDVDGTALVFDKTLPEIQLREKLSKIYNVDFTNFNSTKIGETILINKIIEKHGESKVYDYIETDRGTRKVIKNTRRDEIHLQDVIFDYVKFETAPFNGILSWMKSKTITETKGFFTEIPFEELTILEPHYTVRKKKGTQENLNCIYRGFEYVFGLGGIHGSIAPGIYESDDEYVLIDVDVASYYPNLAIVNRFYPAHLGEEYCDTYEAIYIDRGNYPKKTHPAENLVLKLALNGAYGKSNSEFSALADAQYTMKTTVNGQLLLCMLSEKVISRIPSATMIQINTDGMTVRIKRSDVERFNYICSMWEKLTRLELEHVTYSKMIIKDVNNYIAIKESDVKRKGAAFIYKEEPGELEMHKNYSMLIVPKALEAYYVHGINPEEFIRNHDNMYDFFKRTKLDRKSRLVGRRYFNQNEFVDRDEYQRISRYYVTGITSENPVTKQFATEGQGETLIKLMPPLPKSMVAATAKIEKAEREGKPLTAEQQYQLIKKAESDRESNLEAGYLCTVMNSLDDDFAEQMKSNIYYPYYISEVYKVINTIGKIK